MYGRILFDEGLFQNATEENEQTQTFSFNSHENTKQWQLRVPPNATTLFHRIVHGIFKEGKHEELEGSQNRRTHCRLKTNPNCNWRGVGMDVARQKITVWVFARLCCDSVIGSHVCCFHINNAPSSLFSDVVVGRSFGTRRLQTCNEISNHTLHHHIAINCNQSSKNAVNLIRARPPTAAPRRKAVVRRWIIFFHWSFFLEGMGIGGAVLQPAGHMLSQEQQMWHHLARGRLNSLINTSMHHNDACPAHTVNVSYLQDALKHHPQ